MNWSLKSDVITFRNDGDINFGVFENNTLNIVLVTLSTILSIFFLVPLYIAFIRYDYYGPHSERVILNRLISSMSETVLCYLVFVHSIDILRYINGSFSGTLYI
jgi:hypothetical protein